MMGLLKFGRFEYNLIVLCNIIQILKFCFIYCYQKNGSEESFIKSFFFIKVVQFLLK